MIKGIHTNSIIETPGAFRPYRPTPKIESAMEIILASQGKYDDHDVVDACVEPASPHFS